jgi:hypothetical protein
MNAMLSKLLSRSCRPRRCPRALHLLDHRWRMVGRQRLGDSLNRRSGVAQQGFARAGRQEEESPMRSRVTRSYVRLVAAVVATGERS